VADINSSSALVRVAVIAVYTAQQCSLDLSGSPRLAEFELPSSQAVWNMLNVNLALSAVRTEMVQDWIGMIGCGAGGVPVSHRVFLFCSVCVV